MKKAFIFLFILFVTNIPSIYYGWYLRVSWFDTAQHLLGGFLVAMFMAAYLKDYVLKKDIIKNILIITGATVFIGVVWEFSEYIANQTLVTPFQKWFGVTAYFMGDLEDTIKDLLMDITGAIVFYLFHFLRSRDSHKIEGNL